MKMNKVGKKEDEEGEKKLEGHVHLSCTLFIFLFFNSWNTHVAFLFYFLNKNYTVGCQIT